jgi:hypothetical protein
MKSGAIGMSVWPRYALCRKKPGRWGALAAMRVEGGSLASDRQAITMVSCDEHRNAALLKHSHWVEMLP